MLLEEAEHAAVADGTDGDEVHVGGHRELLHDDLVARVERRRVLGAAEVDREPLDRGGHLHVAAARAHDLPVADGGHLELGGELARVVHRDLGVQLGVRRVLHPRHDRRGQQILLRRRLRRLLRLGPVNSADNRRVLNQLLRRASHHVGRPLLRRAPHHLAQRLQQILVSGLLAHRLLLLHLLVVGRLRVPLLRILLGRRLLRRDLPLELGGLLAIAVSLLPILLETLLAILLPPLKLLRQRVRQLRPAAIVERLVGAARQLVVVRVGLEHDLGHLVVEVAARGRRRTPDDIIGRPARR